MTKLLTQKINKKQLTGVSAMYQDAFHVVDPEDLWREIELLLCVAAYSLLPWRGCATLFCFTRHKCWRDATIFNYYSQMISYYLCQFDIYWQ